MELTYEMIKPFIVHSEVEGNKIIVEFETPSGEIVSSSASIKRSKSIQGQVTRQVGRVAQRQARRVASRLVRGALGGGMMGRLGSRAVRTGTRESMKNMTTMHSQKDKEEAMVTAFRRVKGHFAEEGESKTSSKSGKPAKIKVSKREMESMSPFEGQLKKFPVQTRYDREILARMLVELALSDGAMTEDEQSFLDEIIGDDFGSIDTLSNMDPLSRVECQEVSKDIKPTIYMLAWVVSLVDFELSSVEEQMLLEFADKLSLPDKQYNAMIKAARYYVLEEAIDIDTSKTELFQIADSIQMDREEAERCLIGMKKRV